MSLPLSPKDAQGLAYYNAQEFGVLGPRGWYCFGTSGSGGEALLVSPQPIDASDIFSTPGGLTGSAIVLSHRSDLFDVAQISARIFPDYRAFVIGVMDTFDLQAGYFPYGPYPEDTLTYKSKTMVEYQTPAQTDGLGTYSWLKKNGSPINGVAILIRGTPDLLFLSVRLPRDLTTLTPAIIRQVARDAENPRN